MSGFIFIAIYQFITSRKTKNASYHIIWCIVISFLIKSLLEVLHLFILSEVKFSFAWGVIISAMVAILLSFICAKISETKVLNKLISALSHKSINDNVWKDIIDYEGTTLNIFCKNESISYCGILVAMEENGADSWLILKDYIIQYYDKDEIFDSALLPNPSTLAINLKNADRIELYYNPDTKIFK